VLNALLLFNPADAYRVLNLTGIGGVSQFTGMAGLSQDAALPATGLLLALLLWTAVPLAITTLVLKRRQV
jgi:Cu-processing system permease protein